MARIGRIKIANEVLLSRLQFPFGEIVSIGIADELGLIEIVIKDKEMPEVKEGAPIPDISPIYTRHQNCLGDRVIIREPL